MLTLWRHFAARTLSAFAAALAILALLLVAVDAMLHLASLAEEARSLPHALRLLFERSAAAYGEHLLPIAGFVAAFWCAGTATLRRETLALKASGISPVRAFLPLLALALGGTALHVQLAEGVVAPDRIAVLGEGRIVADGPISTMLASDHPWIQSYFRGKRTRALAALPM